VVLAGLIVQLFAPRDLLTFALQMHNDINLKMSKGDIAGARKVVLAFIDFTVKSYYQNKLRDPNGLPDPGTDFYVVNLIDGLLCWVGLPKSGLVLGPPNAASSPVTTGVIGPGGGDLQANDAAGHGYAALRVPAGTVSADRLWVITRRDGLAPQGCVTTDMEQVGLCIDFSVVPAQDLLKPVTTVICQTDDNAGLQLGHQLPGGKVELLAFAADPFGLPCPHSFSPAPPRGLGSIGRTVWRFGSFIARVLGPKSVYAGHLGLGGLVAPKLSNITAVRARLGFWVQPTPTAPGAVITPAVRVAFLKFGTEGDQVDTAVTNPIRVAIGTDPSESATLSGTLTRNPISGISTFNDLRIDKFGTGYTLEANALSPPATGSVPLGISAASNPFDITGWTGLASMPTARYAFGTGAASGTLYAVGGFNGTCCLATLEAYDPIANTWTAKASMPTPRYIFATGVVNGLLYAVAGQNTSSSTLTTVEAYDPASNTWTARASLPEGTGSNGPAAGAVNGILYVVGGFNTGVYLATVQAYDPTTDTWTAKTSMPTPRAYFGVSVVNGILYAIGGRGSAGVLGTVEAYDRSTDTWTAKASMPTPRAGLRTGVVGGLIYAVASDGITNTVEAYDPAANSWTTKPSVPTPRGVPGVEGINGVLYVVGGKASGPGFLTTNEAYHP
jgi:N-acetylneuraminic acid mutarotase